MSAVYLVFGVAGLSSLMVAGALAARATLARQRVPAGISRSRSDGAAHR